MPHELHGNVSGHAKATLTKQVQNSVKSFFANYKMSSFMQKTNKQTLISILLDFPPGLISLAAHQLSVF